MRSHSPRVNAVLALAFTFVSSFCLSQAVSSSVTVNTTPDVSTTASFEPQAEAAASSTSSTTIKESFFGAGFNGFSTWPPTDGQKQVATLGGIRLWDDNEKWGQIETSKGVYDWSGLDSIMSKAQAQHVDVLYTIGDTPKWAGKIPAK